VSARVTNISWTGGFALRVHHGLRAIANDTGNDDQTVFTVNTLLFGDVWTPALRSGLVCLGCFAWRARVLALPQGSREGPM